MFFFSLPFFLSILGFSHGFSFIYFNFAKITSNCCKLNFINGMCGKINLAKCKKPQRDRWLEKIMLKLVLLGLVTANINIQSKIAELELHISKLSSIRDGIVPNLEEQPDNLPGVTFVQSSMRIDELGMALSHVKELEEFVAKHKIVLFVRQSEPDSVRLIESDRFPSKGPDIHDKSSNWGYTCWFRAS
jgi:hypothetical protein